jgi:hypothetical protein
VLSTQEETDEARQPNFNTKSTHVRANLSKSAEGSGQRKDTPSSNSHPTKERKQKAHQQQTEPKNLQAVLTH